MDFVFRWNAWNIWHIAEHGVRPGEAEYVVRQAKGPHRRRQADDKYNVWGHAPDGLLMQVVYTFSPPGVVYVIHARPLTEHEKRVYRRHCR